MSPEPGRWLASALFAAALVVVAGCDGRDAAGLQPPGDATVWFELTGTSGEDKTVEILFLRPEEASGPRVVELMVARSEAITLVAAEAGEAAAEAGKGLTTQEPDAASIRLVLLATGNLLEIDSGTLVRLTLRGAGTLSFDTSSPTFAPREAEEAARLGPPLEI